MSGALWVFAPRDRACQVAVDVDGSGTIATLGENGDGAVWVLAGQALEVPIEAPDPRDDALRIAVTACPGAEAELQVTVDAWREVRVDAE
ncbi:MAG: hypothetical protein R3F59_05980 [Myxococcota bacterium]